MRDKNLKNISGYIFDLDGVIYKGEELIKGAIETLDLLKELGKKYIFVTNNTIGTKKQYINKLRNFGIFIEDEQILTVNEATINFIKKSSPDKTKVQILGVGGILEDFKNSGLEITEENPDYVVVGWDTKLNYEKLYKSIKNVREGAKFIVTSPDKYVPSKRGLEPAPGTLAAPIEYATGIKPTYIGKPYPPMIDSALKKIGTKPKKTAIVGDTIESDILSKKYCGLGYSVLVLSGNTKKEQLAKINETEKPDLILDSIKDIFN